MQIIIRGYLLLEYLDLNYLTSIFSCKWLISYSHKVQDSINGGPNKSGRLENFLKKKKRGWGGGGAY